jgi:hypothetical protein
LGPHPRSELLLTARGDVDHIFLAHLARLGSMEGSGGFDALSIRSAAGTLLESRAYIVVFLIIILIWTTSRTWLRGRW